VKFSTGIHRFYPVKFSVGLFTQKMKMQRTRFWKMTSFFVILTDDSLSVR